MIAITRKQRHEAKRQAEYESEQAEKQAAEDREAAKHQRHLSRFYKSGGVVMTHPHTKEVIAFLEEIEPTREWDVMEDGAHGDGCIVYMEIQDEDEEINGDWSNCFSSPTPEAHPVISWRRWIVEEHWIDEDRFQAYLVKNNLSLADNS
jgi:quinol monooxygenase YgiN